MSSTSPHLVAAPVTEIPAGAVLLDWDGLLCDSEPAWRQCEDQVADRLGGTLTPADRAALLGCSMERTAEILLRSAGLGTGPDAVAGVIGQLRGWLLWQVNGDGIAPCDGARELLAGVAAAGLPAALVTSSPGWLISAMLRRLDMSRAFTVIVCADDVRRLKPHPDPYQEAARLLGIRTWRCAAIEDSPAGVESARAAGCNVIAVPSAGVVINPWLGLAVAGSLRQVTAVRGGLLVATDVPA
jgi:beta-phosphoglucomutase-like phosphatase (HAD superfamily)